MIIEEYIKDGTMVRHYSNNGFLIRQLETGEDYEEAIDLVPCAYTYVETDIPIEREEEEVEIMISSKNIPNNEYFQIGDKLYYSTASIASGDEIEVGVNCKFVEIADVLNELKED